MQIAEKRHLAAVVERRFDTLLEKKKPKKYAKYHCGYIKHM